MCQKLARAD